MLTGNEFDNLKINDKIIGIHSGDTYTVIAFLIGEHGERLGMQVQPPPKRDKILFERSNAQTSFTIKQTIIPVVGLLYRLNDGNFYLPTYVSTTYLKADAIVFSGKPQGLNRHAVIEFTAIKELVDLNKLSYTIVAEGS